MRGYSFDADVDGIFIIFLHKAMKAQLGSSIVGPESSGKVELVKVQCSHVTNA